MKLRVYQSFEEAAEDEAAAAAAKSPVDAIRETVKLILRVYGVTQEELNMRRKKMHINIIRSK